MKISMINGSPKLGKSVSGTIIEKLSELLEGDDINTYRIGKPIDKDEVCQADALIFAFPLYVDSIPATVLKFLIEMEEYKEILKGKMIYCVAVNGFFEGKQNCIAIENIKHWCKKVGATFGQGIGNGAGEMLPAVINVPLGHGPNKNLGNGLNIFIENIKNGKSGEDIYISPNYPKALWRLQGNSGFFLKEGKKNGLSKQDMYRRLD